MKITIKSHYSVHKTHEAAERYVAKYLTNLQNVTIEEINGRFVITAK